MGKFDKMIIRLSIEEEEVIKRQHRWKRLTQKTIFINIKKYLTKQQHPPKPIFLDFFCCLLSSFFSVEISRSLNYEHFEVIEWIFD